MPAPLHGLKKTPEWRAWINAKQRCDNPRHRYYADYGGRGIQVCARWQYFAAFWADMGPRPAGASLDRINNDGHYEPGNCRWTTWFVQHNNRRNNRRLTFQGETRTVAEWGRSLGVPRTTIVSRLRSGWTVERALTH